MPPFLDYTHSNIAAMPEAGACARFDVTKSDNFPILYSDELGITLFDIVGDKFRYGLN